MLFWYSKSYFDIRTKSENAIMIFKILFWLSNWGVKCYFDIRKPILTFELYRKIVFWHSKSYFAIRTESKMLFWYSKSYFDIRTEAGNAILTFQILFWHSNWVRKSNFDIKNPILTFELRRKMQFWYSKFWYWKSYLDIRTESGIKIFTFKILFWHSNCVWKCNFDIRNPF